MSGRIWPGALCEVRGVRFTKELNGRFVIAVRLAVDGEFFGPDRFLDLRGSPGASWVVKAAVNGGKLPVRNNSGKFFEAERRAVRESCLFPILPPPNSDTTDDTAPCEVEPAQTDRVSA